MCLFIYINSFWNISCVSGTGWQGCVPVNRRNSVPSLEELRVCKEVQTSQKLKCSVTGAIIEA